MRYLYARRNAAQDQVNMTKTSHSVPSKSGHVFIISFSLCLFTVRVIHQQSQPNPPTTVAQLQQELDSKHMLFKKSEVQLGKVIGQGQPIL